MKTSANTPPHSINEADAGGLNLKVPAAETGKVGEGLIDLDEDDPADFVDAARKSRFWERESETPDIV
jgi:hypothetical protein